MKKNQNDSYEKHFRKKARCLYVFVQEDCPLQERLLLTCDLSCCNFIHLQHGVKIIQCINLHVGCKEIAGCPVQASCVDDTPENHLKCTVPPQFHDCISCMRLVLHKKNHVYMTSTAIKGLQSIPTETITCALTLMMDKPSLSVMLMFIIMLKWASSKSITQVICLRWKHRTLCQRLANSWNVHTSKRIPDQ